MPAMDNIFDFLGTPSAQGLPEGPGEFTNGLIGSLMARKLWKFWSPEDITLYGDVYQPGRDYVVRKTGDSSYFYYFFQSEAAVKAAELVKAFSPSYVWCFEMDTASVLNFLTDKGPEAWKNGISADVRITTLDSKYRHEFQMLVLPAIVNALAIRAGFLSESNWSYPEAGFGEAELTEQFRWRMIGHPDADAADQDAMIKLVQACSTLTDAHDLALGLTTSDLPAIAGLVGKVRIPWRFSTAWQRRTALWQALGEPNPDVYLPSNVAVTKKGKELETVSAKLSTCLEVSTREWTKPIWAQLLLVKDPAGSYKNKAGKQRYSRLPLVLSIYADEPAARRAAEVENPTSAQPAGSYPQMPEKWGDARAEWMSALADEKKRLNGIAPTPPQLARLTNNLSCEAQDITAWWSLV